MLFQAQSSALASSKSASQLLLTFNNTVIYITPTRIWTFDYQNRPDLTEITPFFRNFPDPTGSSLRRTGNALILGLEGVYVAPALMISANTTVWQITCAPSINPVAE